MLPLIVFVTVKLVKVPTLVKLEPVTPDPNVDEFKTLVPLI